MDGDDRKEFTPSPIDYKCPKCKSYYRGKVTVLDYKDPEFVDGKRDKPPTIMTFCHGKHPVDPYEVHQ